MTAEFKDGVTPVINRLVRQLPAQMDRGLLEAAQHAEGEIRREIAMTNKGGPRRTGMLARSFQATIIDLDGQPAGQAVSSLIYARIQNEGGTITPTSGTYLAVPVHDGSSTAWPRDRNDLRLFKNPKTGKLLLQHKTSGEIMFVLKKSVRLKARHFIETAQKNAEPGIREILHDRAVVAIKESEE